MALYRAWWAQGWCWLTGGLCWVPGTNRLEGGFQNGACLYWCYHGRTSSPKWLLPSFPPPRGVLLASCLSGRLSKISKWVSPKLLSNCCLWSGTWSMLRLCVLPLRAESQFPNTPSPPPTLPDISSPVFKARRSGGLFPGAQPLGLGNLLWGLDPLLLGEDQL